MFVLLRTLQTHTHRWMIRWFKLIISVWARRDWRILMNGKCELFCSVIERSNIDSFTGA